MTTGTQEQQGIKFVSAGRARSVTYTVRPAVPVRDPLTGRQIGLQPPLEARFKEHAFDAGKAQEANGWTNEEREEVEAYLQNHKDFGRGDGTGIFFDTSETIINPRVQAVLERERDQMVASGNVKTMRCAFMFDAGEETVQCDQTFPETDDSEWCEKHRRLVAQMPED